MGLEKKRKHFFLNSSQLHVYCPMPNVSSLKLFSAYLLRAQSQFELDSEDVHLVSIEFKEKAEQRALLLHQTSLKT